MSLQDKYSKVVSAAQSAEINGLNVVEQDGILYISGNTSTSAAKNKVWDAYGEIDVDIFYLIARYMRFYSANFEDVMDMATVEAAASVVETVSAVAPEVQQKVTDAVKDFPAVKVDVVNGELTLTGEVTAEQARKIKMSVDALKVGKVNYNYNVKK